MSMRSIMPGDVLPCKNCGAAIVETEQGWRHLRVGYGLSSALHCSTTHVAAPKKEPKPKPAKKPMRGYRAAPKDIPLTRAERERLAAKA